MREVRRLTTSDAMQELSRRGAYRAAFWWFYPKIRNLIMSRWKRTNPALAKFFYSTTAVSMAELRAIFPDGPIWI